MGQIKRIQFRGISRTPSDRMTSDGGCAESLNVYLDNDEIAPAIKPKDITSSLMDAGKFATPIYIHATNNYKNIICRAGSSIRFNDTTLVSLKEDETFSDISHIGNTLVISTSKSLHYLLFKENKYHALGGEIPFPTLKVIAQGSELQQSTFLGYEGDTNNQPNQDLKFNPSKWNDYTSEGENSLDVAKRIANQLSEELTKFTGNADNKKYVWPMVVRYAARLYDGTMITSVPFLMAPQNIRGYSTAKGTYSWQLNGDGTGITAYKEKIEVNYALTPYLPYIQLLDFSQDTVEKWKDVIVGIDVYFSDQITPEKLSCVGVSNVNNTADGTTSSFAYADIDLGGTQWSEEKAILSKSVFFKAASYSLSNTDDYNTLTKGTTLPLIKPDDLFVKDQLDPYKDVMEPHTLIPQKLTTFNSRLVAGDIIGKANAGPKFFTSTDNTDDNLEWSFRFFVDFNGEQVEVIRRNIGEINFFTGITPYSWIVYPDVNCKRVDVATDSGRYVSIPMKEHPNLNCSYAYLGKKRLLDYTISSNQSAESVLNKEEKPTFKTSNRLLLSEIDNPIVFPITGRYTIGSGSILGMAAATKYLSQGQFGQYPLYVFTTEGIWAMSTNDLGTFSTSSPLSREICDNPDSITPLEQEVVFTSKKGVMLLSGSDITDLSPNMNGRHYSIEPSAKSIVMNQPGFEEFEQTISDSTPFMAFISKAACAYDYAGKRLIFFSPEEEYQYIYKTDTQTWHKIKVEGYTLLGTLNSYPECYVAAENPSEHQCILNLSTILNAAEEQATEKGVIVSRPFDLGEPDVLKTITDIRVRGQFQKGSVNFILLGSNDGINFYTISTLRGKAWKQFRIILLSKLSQHERISWIDVQYDTKFTNRLR